MELFATARDRLAFLLETDAAPHMDFEALEAQAGAAAEEPSPEKRPKYITNYIGSKQKLVDWIRRIVRKERSEAWLDFGLRDGPRPDKGTGSLGKKRSSTNGIRPEERADKARSYCEERQEGEGGYYPGGEVARSEHA